MEVRKLDADLLRQRLLDVLERSGDLTDPEILEQIDALVLAEGRQKALSLQEKEGLRKELFYSVRKLDILQELLEDDSVTEIMVNGPEQIFVERGGQIRRYEKSFVSRQRLEDVIQRIAGDCNRVVNEQNPIVDARLEDGSRVNVVLPPVALNGPILTIRRFPEEPITMRQLIRWGSITKEAADFLEKLVRCRYSILVGGGTSTGKTTFLNALSEAIPKGERIVTIEDSAELQLMGIENLVRLEAKNANLEENREITIRDLIRTALRMRPDRIIIGEVRSAEAVDFLSCLNTGHDGSLGSAHANSVADMLTRLETMVLMGMQIPIPAIRRQIASGIEILVHLDRAGNGSRQVAEIAEIVGMQGDEILLHPLYERDAKGALVCKEELVHEEKWRKDPL